MASCGSRKLDIIDQVKFDEQGLVAAIAQDFESGEVLMVAYMNRQSLRMTLKSGRMTYWSRSRKELWIKGETSGNIQEVKEIMLDCDGDALLFKIAQEGGGACHMGYRSCFYRRMENGSWVIDSKEVERRLRDV